MDVRDGANVPYCSGEQFHIFNANGNLGNGTWFMDCWVTIYATGSSGTLFGNNNGMFWSGDGATLNGVLAGAAYPGLQHNGLQNDE
jgi:hypothetical protein